MTAWVVDLATKLLEFRIRSLVFDGSNETHRKIRAASWLHGDILNRRWRDCTRQPFDFYPSDRIGEEVPEATVEAGRSLLQALGFKPKAHPVLRRL